MMSVAARGATAVVAAATPTYAAWPPLPGAEMIQGGGCTDPADYTLPAGVTVNVVPGKMVATAATGGAQNDGTPFTAFIEGGTYRCAEVGDSVTVGNYKISIGATVGVTRTTSGTYTQDLVAVDLEATGDGWSIQFTTATAQLDNFSVKSIGLMGVEADWSIAGGGALVWFEGALSFSDAGQSDIGSLTGSALTAFTASVSFSTACLIRFYVPSGRYEGGDISVRVHQGSWVAAAISADGWSTPVAITSGAVAGFDVRGNAGGTTLIAIAAVDIDLA